MRLSIISSWALLALQARSAPVLTNSTNLPQDAIADYTQCPDFCAGTNFSSALQSTYICGDARLGPTTVPTSIPLGSIAGLNSTYHRFGGLCPGQFLATYTNSTTSQYLYPPFDGYQLTTTGQPAVYNITVTLGTFLDRFGSEYGRYMSPAGAPYAQRSLPPSNLDAPAGAAYPYNYRVYTVTRSFTAEAGLIAGWFAQQGMGVQYFMPTSVMELVEGGYLGRVNLTADPNW